ncbi:MAG: PIN domain-containing protein [Nitrososphaerota archaeon]
MSLYDTKFFFENFYSCGENILRKTIQEIRNVKNRYISVIVIHEIYELTLEKEGKNVAKLRIKILEKDFKMINVNLDIAKILAQLRHKYRIPMVDSIIAATAMELNLPCITDDFHLKNVLEIKTKWID